MNRIINIGPASEATSEPISEEIYVDVDILSKTNPNYSDIQYGSVKIGDYVNLLYISEDYSGMFDGLSLMIADKDNNPAEPEKIDEESIQMLTVLKKPNYGRDLHKSVTALWQPRYRIARNVNVRAVQNSLDNIFTWIPGERVLDPEFGNRLYLYLYEGITKYNVEQIVSEIKNVCLKYEPRVNIVSVTNVGTVEDTEDNIVRLNIEYTIKGLSDEIFSKQYIFNRSVV